MKKLKKPCIIGREVEISSEIQYIGSHIYIGDYTKIISCRAIGNFTSISANVKIGLMAHPKDFISTSPFFYMKRRGWVKEDMFDESRGLSCEIGNDVLISDGARIINGVTIGDGAIIGAGAVVTKNVPPYAIAGGVPAEVIGYRFEPEIIARILDSKWWLKSPAVLKANAHLAKNPLEFIKSLDNGAVQ